jgi:hypothetical protein
MPTAGTVHFSVPCEKLSPWEQELELGSMPSIYLLVIRS